MDTATALPLALGLERLDVVALDTWAKRWNVDLSPEIFEEAIRNAEPLDAAADWIFAEIVNRAARHVADEVGIVIDGPDWEANDEGRDFLHALNVYANGSATTVHFGGDNYLPEARQCWTFDDLLAAAFHWHEGRAAA